MSEHSGLYDQGRVTSLPPFSPSGPPPALPLCDMNTHWRVPGIPPSLLGCRPAPVSLSPGCYLCLAPPDAPGAGTLHRHSLSLTLSVHVSVCCCLQSGEGHERCVPPFWGRRKGRGVRRVRQCTCGLQMMRRGGGAWLVKPVEEHGQVCEGFKASPSIFLS